MVIIQWKLTKIFKCGLACRIVEFRLKQHTILSSCLRALFLSSCLKLKQTCGWNRQGLSSQSFLKSHHSQEHMPSLQSWCVGTLYLEITKLYRTSLIQHACLSSRDHPTITKALIYLVILRDYCFPVLQAGIIDFKYVPCFVALMSAYLLQVGTGESFVPHRHDAAHSIINKTTTPTNGGPPRCAHDDLVIFLSSCILLVSYIFLALKFLWVHHLWLHIH